MQRRSRIRCLAADRCSEDAGPTAGFDPAAPARRPTLPGVCSRPWHRGQDQCRRTADPAAREGSQPDCHSRPLVDRVRAAWAGGSRTVAVADPAHLRPASGPPCPSRGPPERTIRGYRGRSSADARPARRRSDRAAADPQRRSRRPRGAARRPPPVAPARRSGPGIPRTRTGPDPGCLPGSFPIGVPLRPRSVVPSNPAAGYARTRSAAPPPSASAGAAPDPEGAGPR
jgi:hypothetical protein